MSKGKVAERSFFSYAPPFSEFATDSSTPFISPFVARVVLLSFTSEVIICTLQGRMKKEDKMTSEVSGVFQTKKEEHQVLGEVTKYAPFGSRRCSITQQQVLGCPAPGFAYPARAAHLNIQKARNRKVSKCVCVLPFACPSQARREKE